MKLLLLSLFFAFNISNLCLALTCDCDYHPGGCVISQPAPTGFKCKCLYKNFWTCAGVAFPCSGGETCPGGRSDYCSCKLGGGDCWAYAEARYPRDYDCTGVIRQYQNSGTVTKAECDCDYHEGGCIISIPAPKDFKCVCAYKAIWRCSGWAHACNSLDYCPGGLYTYCACKHGGGDCGAYPEFSTDPTGLLCNFVEPRPTTCDCNRNSDWTASSYTISDVKYDLSKLQRTNEAPVAIGTEDLLNAGPSQQQIQFWAKEAIQTQASFQREHGISIDVGVKFEAGVPANTFETEIKIGTTHSFTWGQTKTFTKEFSHRFTCNGPPRQHTRCEVLVQRAYTKVPYTMTLTHKSIPNCRCTSSGIYSGVELFDQRLTAWKVGNCNAIYKKKYCTK